MIYVSSYRYGEFEGYTELPSQVVNDKTCDVVFDKPVIFMKLDASELINLSHFSSE